MQHAVTLGGKVNKLSYQVGHMLHVPHHADLLHERCCSVIGTLSSHCSILILL